MARRTGYIYDDKLILHHNKVGSVENPDRVRVPHEYLLQSGLVKCCSIIQSRSANPEELRLVHPQSYIDEVAAYSSSNPYPGSVDTSSEEYPTYVCDATYECARLATGCVLSLVDALLQNKIENGLAVIRPPGHHAESDQTCGFCYFNNLAVAARYMQKMYSISRILILDWDVHHGNGLQHTFQEDPGVLYVSLHRYDNGEFFPKLKDGAASAVGIGPGEGYIVNIPWNNGKKADADYQAAFRRIIRPIITSFKPEVTLIACGLDAAEGDPLGEYGLTPECYGWMTQNVLKWTNGRALVVLEGGYNTKVMGKCLHCILNALLRDDSHFEDTSDEPSTSGNAILDEVMQIQSKYWKFT